MRTHNTWSWSSVSAMPSLMKTRSNSCSSSWYTTQEHGYTTNTTIHNKGTWLHHHTHNNPQHRNMATPPQHNNPQNRNMATPPQHDNPQHRNMATSYTLQSTIQKPSYTTHTTIHNSGTWLHHHTRNNPQQPWERIQLCQFLGSETARIRNCIDTDPPLHGSTLRKTTLIRISSEETYPDPGGKKNQP